MKYLTLLIVALLISCSDNGVSSEDWIFVKTGYIQEGIYHIYHDKYDYTVNEQGRVFFQSKIVFDEVEIVIEDSFYAEGLSSNKIKELINVRCEYTLLNYLLYIATI